MARNKKGKHPAKRSGQPDPPKPRVRQEEIFPGAISLERTDYHSGPLPTPQSFSEYEQVLQGAAERILSMAEIEQGYRHEIGRGILRMESRNSGLGLVCAFILGLLGIAGGLYVITLGADLVGAGVALAALVSLLTVFIVGRKDAD